MMYLTARSTTASKTSYDYGTAVLDGMGVFDETGVFVGLSVGDGGKVFVGVGEGSAVGVMISSAR